MKKRAGRKKGEAAQEEQRVIPGYIGKQKGKRHMCWQRGWLEPGKKYVTKDLDKILAACEDFRNETTKLESLILSRGHLLKMSPKGHCELAGAGVEYCWGKSKCPFGDIFKRQPRERIWRLCA